MAIDNKTYGFSRPSSDALLGTLHGGDVEIPGYDPLPVIGGGGATAIIVKLPSGGIAGRTDRTLPSGTCTVQTLSSCELVDSSTTVTGYSISPNKTEGIDPRDGTSPMFAWAVSYGDGYIVTPMPWTTEATSVVHDMDWGVSGLTQDTIVDIQLPVHDTPATTTVAGRYDCTV